MKSSTVMVTLHCLLLSLLVPASARYHELKGGSGYIYDHKHAIQSTSNVNTQPYSHTGKHAMTGAGTGGFDNGESKSYDEQRESYDASEVPHYLSNEQFVHDSSNDHVPINKGESYDIVDKYNYKTDEDYGHKQGTTSISLVVSDPTDAIPGSTSLTTLISTSFNPSSLTSGLTDASPESTTVLTTASTTLISSRTSVSTTSEALPSTPQDLCSGHDTIIGDVHCLGNFLIGCSTLFNAVNRNTLDLRNVPNVPNKEACHQKCIEDPLCTGWTCILDSVEGLKESGISVGDGYCRHVYSPVELDETEPFTFGDAFGLRGFCDFPIAELASTSTGSATSATTVTLQTVPTSATDICPDLGGQCLDNNYIQCDRVLQDDAGTSIGIDKCIFQPGIKSERACHQTCLLDNKCYGWIMEQVQDFDDFGNGKSYYCCHLNTTVQLPDPLPAKGPFSTFPAYDSYGLKGSCPADVGSICPRAENACVDDFKVRCGRLIFNDVTPLLEGIWQPDIREDLACHQACAEDPDCTTWWGELDPIFNTFTCFRGTSAVAIKTTIAMDQGEEFTSSFYGIRGACG
ncbi:hypothetical protein PFICI_03640 [Pestalotiopsis fici W106-1]|uniref:Apple domain-containing protein n=1 Tax=Pestalotiopsis fici (strain W106-1 / CGMCC3.15140) TaxID=1229662 RepID=W3XHW7_PESFW|nr:uncharacterized protein PFICI_03640 [Pestalotiopsis fici W106-1]ETS85615.1 hypothetical protein PFICI_03640 [Pestalotiopsis fici W106-1]